MNKRDWQKDWWDATGHDALDWPKPGTEKKWFEKWLQQRAALQYWLQRVRELKEDIAFLTQEYGNSNEPMTQDALELKRRCRILEERARLEQQVRELEETVRITSAANEDLATAIQRLKEENARLKAVVEPLVMQDREMLLKKVKDLKQTDGESWAIGEIIERALAALEEEE